MGCLGLSVAFPHGPLGHSTGDTAPGYGHGPHPCIAPSGGCKQPQLGWGGEASALPSASPSLMPSLNSSCSSSEMFSCCCNPNPIEKDCHSAVILFVCSRSLCNVNHSRLFKCLILQIHCRGKRAPLSPLSWCMEALLGPVSWGPGWQGMCLSTLQTHREEPVLLPTNLSPRTGCLVSKTEKDARRKLRTAAWAATEVLVSILALVSCGTWRG